MRVRVWIQGLDGPSHDFELLSAPRVGERISVAVAGQTEDGIVTTVTWQLQAIERSGSDLSIEAEPTGSVSLVHVICRPMGEAARQAQAYTEMEQGSDAAH
ncbi:hypothetical protein [Phenylobacterium sp.]|jgi:hypothetical protein|uniref:hypothetical protein n=1 Tax=Phenylobacterium sp. TaxID=1871053 RepID=UPI002E34B773|nr:hypothetical protein [Phenylobacterium sp.]HEX2558578.1 hypothetical protein [Phenylobacterium sp.]